MVNFAGAREVHVLNSTDDLSYELNERNLADILLQDNVKDKKVVIVSIAGSFRTGKSFMLDFFLRYLYAEQSQKNSNAWLGTNDEELRGFDWRGGSESHTTGMLMWSKPIPATLPNGEEVVIILMDTQGAFGTDTSTQQCSLLFALSTLISSVQIYNIKENIKEDYLQHLTVFTNYGRLARSDRGTPFQHLKFLVRDWMFPYEHTYGTAGGMALLQRRMTVTGRESADLREIRQNLTSYFEKMDCFLMPMLGAGMTNPQFRGRISELPTDFKNSLLDLVPSIFASDKLIVKKINGRCLTATDLYNLFKRYMDVFNSGSVPEPISIVRATAVVSMMMAANEAKKKYQNIMDRECGPRTPSIPVSAMASTHAMAKSAAEEYLDANRTNSPQTDDEIMTSTMEEIDNLLPMYETMNENKISRAKSETRDAYQGAIRRHLPTDSACMHPTDLKEMHDAAITDAMAKFDTSRKPPQSFNITNDEERNALKEELEENFSDLNNRNSLWNQMAVDQSKAKYLELMRDYLQPCMGETRLQLKHSESANAVLAFFVSKRTRHVERAGDTYKEEIIQMMDNKRSELITLNRNNNTRAEHDVVDLYKTRMDRICGDDLPCLHPDDLTQEHNNIQEAALRKFNSDRTFGQNDHEGPHSSNIIARTNDLVRPYVEANEKYNKELVEEALLHYGTKMDDIIFSLWNLLSPGGFPATGVMLPFRHSSYKEDAIKLFHSKRRSGPTRETDYYLAELERRIANAYTVYSNPIKVCLRQRGHPYDDCPPLDPDMFVNVYEDLP